MLIWWPVACEEMMVCRFSDYFIKGSSQVCSLSLSVITDFGESQLSGPENTEDTSGEAYGVKRRGLWPDKELRCPNDYGRELGSRFPLTHPHPATPDVT